MSTPITVTVAVTITVEPDEYEREYGDDPTRENIAAWLEGVVSDAVEQHPLHYLYRTSGEVSAK